jgi:hypothetical protein
MVLALAGCAPHTFTSNIRPDLSNPDKVGYLVGSIGMKERFDNLSLEICNAQHQPMTVGPSYQVGSWLRRSDDEKEILKDGFSGNSFVIPLPEGTYEFCGHFMAEGPLYSRETKKFSQPFTVAAQKVNYVGRYTGMMLMGKNLFGNPVPASAYWVVNDRQAEDMPFILKRDPTLTSRPVVSTVPPEEKLLRPFFWPKAPQ